MYYNFSVIVLHFYDFGLSWSCHVSSGYHQLACLLLFAICKCWGRTYFWPSWWIRVNLTDEEKLFQIVKKIYFDDYLIYLEAAKINFGQTVNFLSTFRTGPLFSVRSKTWVRFTTFLPQPHWALMGLTMPDGVQIYDLIPLLLLL